MSRQAIITGDCNMKKYKIGYTTGVFDMFHVGHLNIIEKAKEQCEFLIVGVSTDEVVREYKNKTPVIPYEQRKRIVEAIRFVDKVVPQTTMDKTVAWDELKFDVIFHGDDWKGSGYYNECEEKLKEKGVDVVFIPHTPGISSTEIVERIK